jgi:unsaturated rhamnogalacturonyl hydrolase
MTRNYVIFVFLAVCLFLFPSAIQSIAQNHVERSDYEVITQIADNILVRTTYDFINPETNEIISSLDQSGFSNNILVRSPYNGWFYWNGVLHIGMLRMHENLNKPHYKDFVVKNYAFAFDHYKLFMEGYTNQNRWRYPFAQMFSNHELDDCGAMGAGLIEAYQIKPRKEYLDYINTAADYILTGQVRLDDNTLVRHRPVDLTLWGDDLYMAISFLSRMGKFTGDNKYFDDAIHQVKKFNQYLYSPYNGIYYHCWFHDTQENGVAFWGRCNGWIMLAQIELLDHLPENYPGRDELINILRQQVVGAARYQDVSGLWNQLLDKRDSYLETSVTAMFTYCIAKAVNEGWLESRYINIALYGWEGVKSMISEDGQVSNICVGTNIQNDIAYYYNRPAPTGDTHGLGPILLAGNEIIKYKKLNQ